MNDGVKEFYERYPFPNWDYRIKEIERVYSKPILDMINPKNASVLDVGCGTGEISILLASKGARVKGIDFSSAAIHKAGEKARTIGVNVDFEAADFWKYSDDKKYDVVLCIGVIHHDNNPEKFFSKIASHVKEGGKLIVTVYSKYGRTRMKLLKLLPEKIRYRLYKNMNVYMDGFHHPHESEHTVSEVCEWFNQEGFVIDAISPKPCFFGDKGWIVSGHEFFTAAGTKL